MDIVTADLFDRYNDKVDVCDLPFRNFGGRTSFFGPCQTLKLFEDHSPIREACGEPGRGRILIVDAGGSLRVGVFGDRIAAFAIEQGWAGIIISGAIRDSTVVAKLNLGIKALGTTARRAMDKTQGQIGGIVGFGNAVFHPGDWVYADADSVIVSRTELDLSSAKGARH